MTTTKKIALVTGAGSGIGRATAIALGKAGWTIVLAGRRKGKLDETGNLCQAETLVIPTDLTDRQSVERLFEKTKNTYGRLELLFNNAGINIPGKPLEQVSHDAWQSIVDINISAAFWCVQEAFKIMKQQRPMGGRIINNGSISAHLPRPNSAAYTITKHAITGLTKAASLEGRAHNIACGQIDIGNATSKMTEEIEKGVLQADGSYKKEAVIKVEDVGNTIVHLASLPLGTNVPFITLMANSMPYIGRG